MSEIRATTISDAAGTGPITLTGQHAVKAWCLNETLEAATDWSNESFNISSFTDDGTGSLYIDMTTAFSSTNYACIGCHCSNSADDNVVTKVTGFTASREHIYIYDSALRDGPVSWLALGDLA